MARGATWDAALEQRVGEAIAEEVRAKGASVLLAPTINLLRHPRWGRAQETYGEDPLHVGRMGVAFIRGAQRHALASAKHFAVNSIEDTRLVVDVSVDERTLREIYLPHFRMAVEQGHVASVMAAYNMVNGHFNAENFHLLRDVLKGRVALPGLRRVRLVRRHAQHRAVGDGRPRHRDAGAGVLRRAAPGRDRGRRSGADLGDRRRRAPHPAREALLPARQRPAGSGSDPHRDPGTPRPGARGGARGRSCCCGTAEPRCRSIARASRRSRSWGAWRTSPTSATRAAAWWRPSFAMTPLDGIRALRRRDRR